MAQNFLDEQIQEYERRLTAAEEQLVEFKKNNVGLMPDEQGGFYTRLQNAQSQIEKTKSDLRLAKERYTELRKQISGESPMLSSASYAGSSAARLREYREQLADLMTQFTDEHPDVQALRSKIENLQTSNTTDSYLNEPIGGGGTGEFNPVYQELKVQESQARIEVGRYQILLAEQQGNLNELQKSIDIMPQVEANLVKLNRDYEITKERYLSLVERRESARLARKVEQNSSDITFRVVDAPIVPHLASGPDRPLLLAGVLFVALGAGTAWSVLMFLLFPTFIDYKQLRSMIDLPVLGSISLYLGPEQKSHRRTQLMKFTLAILLLMGIFGSVLWFQEPGSALVRSFISGLGIYI
jgi:polysaccharide chain length determinant protein (PEP-CTERM system associated)